MKTPETILTRKTPRRKNTRKMHTSESRNLVSDEKRPISNVEFVHFFRVNPIVGCVEPERPSPFEGMTDEQKEYEAMKLVNLINDLHNVGVIKPAVPGPDGRPVEVEHVLQLQENLPNVGEVNNPPDGDQDSD